MQERVTANKSRARLSGLRVVFALIIREMSTTYGRSAGGYIWAILEPVGAIALMSLVEGVQNSVSQGYLVLA